MARHGSVVGVVPVRQPVAIPEGGEDAGEHGLGRTSVAGPDGWNLSIANMWSGWARKNGPTTWARETAHPPSSVTVQVP